MKYSMLLLCLVAGNASAQDWFPLHVGNQWIYRTDSRLGLPLLTVVDIPRTETVGDQTYSEVRGFEEGPALLRMTDNGTLLRYNRDSKSEEVLAAFQTGEGDTYRSAINTCSPIARMESRSAKTTVPAGEFSNGLLIRYPAANCADAGLETDFFAPYIGLVERTSTTIIGPRRMQLIYARVGGVTVLSAPEVSFTVALDKAVYAAGDGAIVRLAFRNTSATPVTLNFNSGQRFDIVIRNAAGAEVYRWSAGRGFASVLGVETFATGERNYAEAIRLLNFAGQPLAAGRYSLDAWIANSAAPQYAGTVGFDIR